MDMKGRNEECVDRNDRGYYMESKRSCEKEHYNDFLVTIPYPLFRDDKREESRKYLKILNLGDPYYLLRYGKRCTLTEIF
jgi:hypothetical protein